MNKFKLIRNGVHVILGLAACLYAYKGCDYVPDCGCPPSMERFISKPDTDSMSSIYRSTGLDSMQLVNYKELYYAMYSAARRNDSLEHLQDSHLSKILPLNSLYPKP